MLKQVLRAGVIAALLVAVASPAWAGTINVILDDPTGGGQPGVPWILPYGSNNPYNLMWQPCNGPDSPVPGNELAATGHYQDCLAILNNTGFSITNLILTIPDNNSSDNFSCTVPPPVVNPSIATGFGCSSSNVGGVVTLDFIGTPGFQPNTEIYVGVGLPGDDLSGIGQPTALVPSYDPSTLVLVVVGMSMLTMAGVRRYA
jgi:hypothetical protein